MSNATLPIHIKSVLPMDGSGAVFLGDLHKTIVIHMDSHVAGIMQNALHGVVAARPLTHDLMGCVFLATGCKLERVVINDVNEGTFFARLILVMQNEISARKIMEIDARPSDSLILAIRQKAPILISQEVYDACEDVTELWKKLTAAPARKVQEADDAGLSDDEDDDDDVPF